METTQPNHIKLDEKPTAVSLMAAPDEVSVASDRAPWSLDEIRAGHTGQVVMKETLATPIIMTDAHSTHLTPRFGQNRQKHEI